MLMSSFDKLLSYIRESLKVDYNMAWLQGGDIILEILLYCTLCYLAGGSYTDIFFLLVYQVHHSTVLYGRQCMPLSGGKNSEFHGPIQKKTQWKLWLGSHLLALIVS